ncbi:MAG: hypothetical protein JO000_29040 [Alphaproteobacteria bacterium]|nr:hypothetical protein [Alphaproteobacteria bacterium]
MFGRIERGWSMAKASFTVLRNYPKLVVLPVLSAIALLLALAVLFGIVMVGAGSFEAAGLMVKNLDETVGGNKIATAAGVILTGWLFTSVSLYFNAALVFCVLRAFNGERPSIREGLATATGRLPQIIGWAFVAAVIGFAINMIQQFLKDKLGFLGSLLGGLFDFAWAAVTYFVLPVLVVEGLGPVGAFKRSSSILRQTWGEAATGSVGLGAIGFLLCIPAFLLIALGIFVSAGSGNAAAAFVLLPLAFLYLVAMTAVMGALGTVLQTGLYVYATTGRAPFDETIMRAAFQPKA